MAVQAGDDGIRFLQISGKPFGEPVAWYGPIVMNTQEAHGGEKVAGRAVQALFKEFAVLRTCESKTKNPS